MEKEGDDWIERVVSDRNVIKALIKMRASGQAAGSDGWKRVLLRWANRWVQKEYARELRKGIRERNLPDIWSVRLVNLIAKKGKDETWLENRRDVWNACHGLKTITICLNDEYVRVEDHVIRGSQSGFTANMDMAMAGTTAVLQTEETTVLCMGGGESIHRLQRFLQRNTEDIYIRTRERSRGVRGSHVLREGVTGPR